MWYGYRRARPAAAAIPAEDCHMGSSARGRCGLRGGHRQHPSLSPLPRGTPPHPSLGTLSRAHSARELLATPRRRHRRRRTAARRRAASERRAPAAPRAIILKVSRVPSRRIAGCAAGSGAAATGAAATGAAATGREVARVLRQHLPGTRRVTKRRGKGAGAGGVTPDTGAVHQARLERP